MPRLDYVAAAPEGLAKVYELQRYVSGLSEFDPILMCLIQLRASQLNGCAFCLHLHALELRELGERDVRIDSLATWRETSLFSGREQAALAWTEAVTEVGKDHVPDEVYDAARAHFGEKELVDLTLAVVLINIWNRFAISFRQDPEIAPMVLEQVKRRKARAEAGETVSP